MRLFPEWNFLIASFYGEEFHVLKVSFSFLLRGCDINIRRILLQEWLVVSKTWESFVKLPHDATYTMEQVSSELQALLYRLTLTSSPQALSVCVGSIRSPDW